MVNKPANKLYVIKRGGYAWKIDKFHILTQFFCVLDKRKEEVYIDKITSRIQKLCYGLNMDFVDPVFSNKKFRSSSLLKYFFQVAITLKVVSGLYPGVTTVELDTLAAETAASMTSDHPDYAILAARIAVSNLHKETKKQFSGKSNAIVCLR